MEIYMQMSVNASHSTPNQQLTSFNFFHMYYYELNHASDCFFLSVYIYQTIF